MDRPGRALRLAKPAFPYLLAAACLVWLFHDVQLGRLLRDVAGIRWGWVAPAIVFDVLSYLSQGWRWALLLCPVGRISTLRATQAIYAGLFTNEVLPMRVGEVVRALLVSRWMSVNFSAVVPSMMVERLFDVVWLAVSFGFTALFVPLPENLLEAGDILGITVLLATAGFVFVILRKRSSESAPKTPRWKPLRLVASFLGTLESGLRAIGRSHAVYLSLAVSVLLLLGQILAFWLIMWAYGLRVSFWVGAVVLLIVRVGTALPNAPANLGTYQFFTVVGLALFGVEKTLATGFSLVVFFLLTAPLWLIGLFAIGRSGMTLRALLAEVRKLGAGHT
jgi:uncharacterized protein (TIRG00374 family)